MFIDKVFPMWNKVDEQLSPNVDKVAHLKKLLMYKGKPLSMNKLRAKLNAESGSYNDEQVYQYTLLMLVFDAFESHLRTEDLPASLDSIDKYIQDVVARYRNKNSDKVVKVMDNSKFLELYPEKLMADDEVKYSSSELCHLFGVFTSVFTANKSYNLDHSKYEDVLAVESQTHLNDLASLPINDTTDRYMRHLSYLLEQGEFKYHVPYVLPSSWFFIKGGVKLTLTCKGQNIVIFSKNLVKVENDISPYYKAKVKINDYHHEMHLLC